MAGQSVQLDVFLDRKRNIYPAFDLISELLAYRHTRDSHQPGEERELGGRLRKFSLRFRFGVRKKLIPRHRLPCLIEHAEHDADSFELVTSIYDVAGLTAHVEPVCEASHDRIPSSIFLFSTRALEMRAPFIVAALAKGLDDGDNCQVAAVKAGPGKNIRKVRQVLLAVHSFCTGSRCP